MVSIYYCHCHLTHLPPGTFRSDAYVADDLHMVIVPCPKYSILDMRQSGPVRQLSRL